MDKEHNRDVLRSPRTKPEIAIREITGGGYPVIVTLRNRSAPATHANLAATDCWNGSVAVPAGFLAPPPKRVSDTVDIPNRTRVASEGKEPRSLPVIVCDRNRRHHQAGGAGAGGPCRIDRAVTMLASSLVSLRIPRRFRWSAARRGEPTVHPGPESEFIPRHKAAGHNRSLRP